MSVKEKITQYQQAFKERWLQMQKELGLPRYASAEDTEDHFLSRDIFGAFFDSEEVLTGYFLWSRGGRLDVAIDVFNLMYADWEECYIELVGKTNTILKRLEKEQYKEIDDRFHKDLYEKERMKSISEAANVICSNCPEKKTDRAACETCPVMKVLHSSDKCSYLW
jgi:hypothetical protein